jgi:hypothetical protein
MSRSVILLFTSAIAFGQSLDVTTGLKGMVDRHLTEVATRLLAARSARVSQIATPAAVSERQEYIRRTLIEEIGGFPREDAAERSHHGDTWQRDGLHRREADLRKPARLLRYRQRLRAGGRPRTVSRRARHGGP